jgi:hypothetical protein
MQESTLLWAVLAAIGLALACFVWIVHHKGRRIAGEHVFRASRLSKGNHLLPTQVVINTKSVIHYQPQWIGRLEHSIHIAHIASVTIDTNLLFSDVYIETTGGAAPIHCRGHRRHDAEQMKHLIEQFQSAYYQGEQNKATGAPRV